MKDSGTPTVEACTEEIAGKNSSALDDRQRKARSKWAKVRKDNHGDAEFVQIFGYSGSGASAVQASPNPGNPPSKLSFCISFVEP